MASCGTDLIHHIDFLINSKKYRRYFVKTLNDEYTYGRFLSEEGGKNLAVIFLNQSKTLSIMSLVFYYYFHTIILIF